MQSIALGTAAYPGRQCKPPAFPPGQCVCGIPRVFSARLRAAEEDAALKLQA